MKILLIGYGSIGKRHEEVLSKLVQVNDIDLVTKQEIINKKTYKSLETIENISAYDYFIIATETNKHFQQLNYLEKKVKDKIVFCEKPLFETNKVINIINNKVFIGYVLRFHPLLQKLKFFLQTEKIISINTKCGQYLPSWRPDSDYKKSYSSKKSEGGGVLLDLSHEIDYVQWISGKFKEVKSYQTKISDLEIDSDDLTMVIGKTEDHVIANISIDYISKISHRKLIIETFESTYELDLISNRLIKKDKAGLEEVYSFSNLERNYMFKMMHLDILNKQENICTFNEGLEVMNTISIIQEQNK